MPFPHVSSLSKALDGAARLGCGIKSVNPGDGDSSAGVGAAARSPALLPNGNCTRESPARALRAATSRVRY